MDLNIKEVQDISDCDKTRIDLHIHTFCIELLTEISLYRKQELLMVLRKLKKNGININIDELVKKDGFVSARGIANTFVSYGFAENKHEADIKYLNEGGIAYVRKYKVSPKRAIETIVKAGDLAVLAHPLDTIYQKMYWRD